MGMHGSVCDHINHFGYHIKEIWLLRGCHTERAQGEQLIFHFSIYLLALDNQWSSILTLKINWQVTLLTTQTRCCNQTIISSRSSLICSRKVYHPLGGQYSIMVINQTQQVFAINHICMQPLIQDNVTIGSHSQHIEKLRNFQPKPTYIEEIIKSWTYFMFDSTLVILLVQVR